MAGGLMTLAAKGAQNIILNGNPTKTFFKAKYNKYTPFAMQKFRLDYTGLKILRFSEDTFMEFKVKRYADLFHDAYIVISLPDIYSSVYFPSSVGYPDYDSSGVFLGSPYEFRWVDHLGTNLIRQITILGGGQILAQYSGEYLDALKERDFDSEKKKLWHKMTGHQCELNDPGNCYGNINAYPSVLYDHANPSTIMEPSIRGRKLYIPIEAWFGVSSKLAIPLVSIQYNEISIKVTFRPIRDLYKIRDVEDITNEHPVVAPDPTNPFHQFWRFIHPPEDTSGNYSNQRIDWNADIHILGTYIFLDKDEQRQFAETEQQYLVKQVFESDFFNITGSTSTELNSRDLVADYMWRFRRSDAFMRNEWSNYSNWAYDGLLPIPPDNTVPPSPYETIFVYTSHHRENQKNILYDLAIAFDGELRENLFTDGMYNYIEKWIRTTGNAKDGLYCYNFCMNSNPREYQPSGATNMSLWSKIRFDFNTIEPPLNAAGVQFDTICNDNNEIIGVRKPLFTLHDYTYDMRVWEGRYNVIKIMSGRIGLMYAR